MLKHWHNQLRRCYNDDITVDITPPSLFASYTFIKPSWQIQPFYVTFGASDWHFYKFGLTLTRDVMTTNTSVQHIFGLCWFILKILEIYQICILETNNINFFLSSMPSWSVNDVWLHSEVCKASAFCLFYYERSPKRQEKTWQSITLTQSYIS